MIACLRCGIDNAAEARFCNQCGTPLSYDAGRSELRKTVTVLFADVTGSTALGERLDPESFRRLLFRYFEEAKRIVERHGGTVEKFIGDAVMAIFGVPHVHEDDAIRAVRAALELRDSMSRLNVELRRDYATILELKIGVNTGQVVTGTEERLATGDAVNVAARLEQAADPGEVLIGEETYALVSEWVSVEPGSDLDLRGKQQAVTAYRLLSAPQVQLERKGRFDGPMVGRGRQMRLLAESFESVCAERSCHLFTILGSAGVGKSRLITEFLLSLEAGLVVRGGCLSYGEGITYWPVAEVVKQLGGADRVPDASAASALRVLLRESEEPVTPEVVAWAVRRLLETRAAEIPVICVFEDIHWGEQTFLELIEHIADLSRGAPIFVVCLARLELLDRRPDWGGGKLNATTILLEPLSEQEANELIGHLSHDSKLDAEARDRVRQAADGNPLFMEEMLALLANSLDNELRTPASVQALLNARLDQLESEERAVLERGSIEGVVFHVGAVQALGPSETTLLERLIGLVRKELLRPDQAQLPGEDAFRFRHLLIRDAAYEALPKALRAELHERFAGWLEKRATDLVEKDEILGFHLEQAVRFRRELGPFDDAGQLATRARARLSSAGRRAINSGDFRAAVNLFDRAVAISDREDGLPELLLELVTALKGAGDLATAAMRTTEAAEVARLIGDRIFEVRAGCEHAELRALSDPGFTATATIEAGEQAVSALTELGDEVGIAKAWQLIAHGENTRANWAGMEKALLHALAHAKQAGDRPEELHILPQLALCSYWGPGSVSLGLKRCEALIEEMGIVEPLPRAIIAGFRTMEGQFDEGRRLLRDAESQLEALGWRMRLAWLAFFSGPLELAAGDPAAAEVALRRSCRMLQEMGETGWLSSLANYLAEALYQQDRLEEAELWVEESRVAASTDDRASQCWWRAVEAKVLARRKCVEEGEQLARQSVIIADETDQTNDRAFCRSALAEVLEAAGKPEEAVAELQAALALYEQKENVVGAAKTRSLLQRLST